MSTTTISTKTRLTLAEATADTLPVMRGLVTITTNDGAEVGIIQVSRNVERLTATRLADGATVKTDYNGTTIGDLAEWLQNPTSWRSDQK